MSAIHGAATSMMTEPPVAGVDDEVTNGRRLIVQEQGLDMTGVAVGGMDVIRLDRTATAQMRVVAFVSMQLYLGLDTILRGCGACRGFSVVLTTHVATCAVQ